MARGPHSFLASSLMSGIRPKLTNSTSEGQNNIVAVKNSAEISIKKCRLQTESHSDLKPVRVRMEKSPGKYPGFKSSTLKLSSRTSAVSPHVRLHSFSGRRHDFLSQCRKFTCLLGQNFELLACLVRREFEKLRRRLDAR